jgi:hypothetical protein
MIVSTSTTAIIPGWRPGRSCCWIGQPRRPALGAIPEYNEVALCYTYGGAPEPEGACRGHRLS